MTLVQVAQSIRYYIGSEAKYNLYAYGSRVYGSHDADSDFDFQLVVEDKYLADHPTLQEDLSAIISTVKVDVSVSSLSQFQTKLEDHEVAAVETFYLPEQFRFQEDFPLQFILNKSKLRHSFSQVVSNSWVKSKKKLTVQADYNERAARKSLYHSIRILQLGCNIAVERYVDLTSFNTVLAEINSLPADWDVLDKRFRPLHNGMLSNFRILCPK